MLTRVTPLRPAEGPVAAEASRREETLDRELAVVIGSNLRRLRKQHSLSLEQLARKSGVSRAMLGQIELGRSVPTVTLLWKTARALGVQLSAMTRLDPAENAVFISAQDAKVLCSPDGAFRSRALFPDEQPGFPEFYEVTLAGLGSETVAAHPAGTFESLVVSQGSVEVTVQDKPHLLAAGDALFFAADHPRAYRNPTGDDARFYRVLSHVESHRR